MTRSTIIARERVVAFRLDSHHLAARLPAGKLVEAAGACGLQDTPPGSAALAVHARVAGVTPEAIDRTLGIEKSLLVSWSLRGAPYMFPVEDAAVFTQGLLPDDEASLRVFILGAGSGLDKVGISAGELCARTAEALHVVLDGRELDKDALGVEIAARLEPALTVPQQEAWRSPSDIAAGQTLGESLVRFALAVVALRGTFCLAPRPAGHRAATFLRIDQWLGAPLPRVDPAQARAELVRRYLHCFGPSTSRHFGEWAGIAPAQAARAWRLVEHDLVEVDFEGTPAWLLAIDLPGLVSARTAHGVRLLPPHDPYLQLRDRATIIPDLALQRRLWRASGNPGVVLAGGECVAAWRPQKAGNRLQVIVEPFAPIAKRVRTRIEREAESLAPFKGCGAVEVAWAEPGAAG